MFGVQVLLARHIMGVCVMSHDLIGWLDYTPMSRRQRNVAECMSASLFRGCSWNLGSFMATWFRCVAKVRIRSKLVRNRTHQEDAHIQTGGKDALQSWA